MLVFVLYFFLLLLLLLLLSFEFKKIFLLRLFLLVQNLSSLLVYLFESLRRRRRQRRTNTQAHISTEIYINTNRGPLASRPQHLQVAPKRRFGLDGLEEGQKVARPEAVVIETLDKLENQCGPILDWPGEYLQQIALLIEVNQNFKLP